MQEGFVLRLSACFGALILSGCMAGSPSATASYAVTSSSPDRPRRLLWALEVTEPDHGQHTYSVSDQEVPLPIGVAGWSCTQQKTTRDDAEMLAVTCTNGHDMAGTFLPCVRTPLDVMSVAIFGVGNGVRSASVRMQCRNFGDS